MSANQWNEEADVIIVGYGLSGAVAAIEARDHGAEVIILEKSQYPGGCSILSGGMVLCARNAEDATKYLIATSGGRVDESLIRPFAQDLADNEEYLRKLAQPYNATVKTTKEHEPGETLLPNLPGRVSNTITPLKAGFKVRAGIALFGKC